MPMDNQTYIHASIQKHFAQNTFLQQCTADGCLRDKFECSIGTKHLNKYIGKNLPVGVPLIQGQLELL